jgi:hypothetical protein
MAFPNASNYYGSGPNLKEEMRLSEEIANLADLLINSGHRKTVVKIMEDDRAIQNEAFGGNGYELFIDR